MKIEVLTIEGCPNVENALANVKAAIAAVGVQAEVSVVRVESAEMAERLRFLGSPTVRVAGIDVDSSSAARDDYGLQCRVYSMGGRLCGAPPVEWIASDLDDVLFRD